MKLTDWYSGDQCCKKCNGKMIPSKALDQILSGVPDFPNDKQPVTLSPSGRARLIDCEKCSQCGWSVSK